MWWQSHTGPCRASQGPAGRQPVWPAPAARWRCVVAESCWTCTARPGCAGRQLIWPAPAARGRCVVAEPCGRWVGNAQGQASCLLQLLSNKPRDGCVPWCSSCRPAPQQASASQAGEAPPWGGRQSAGQQYAACSEVQPNLQAVASVTLLEQALQGACTEMYRCRPCASRQRMTTIWQVLAAQSFCDVPRSSAALVFRCVADRTCISGTHSKSLAQLQLLSSPHGLQLLPSPQGLHLPPSRQGGSRPSEAAGRPTAA